MPVEDWLRGLDRDHGVSRAAHAVIQAIIAAPQEASYASVAELAAAAGVDGATITRTARAVGYTGWPAFRQELRSRFLAYLSFSEIAAVRRSRAKGQPFEDTLDRQIENLEALRREMDHRPLEDVAALMAAAPRRFVIASGSFSGVGRVLAHNATLAGYRTDLLDEQAAIANTLAMLQPADLVICMSFWRMFRSTVTAARQAREVGATVCVVSDQASTVLAEIADHLLLVPAEGASVFPSLVPALTVVDALLAQLAASDSAHTQQALAAAERQWRAFDIVQFGGSDQPMPLNAQPVRPRSQSRRPRRPAAAP